MRPPLGLEKQPAGPRDPSAALKRKRPVYFKELRGFVQALAIMRTCSTMGM